MSATAITDKQQATEPFLLAKIHVKETRKKVDGKEMTDHYPNPLLFSKFPKASPSSSHQNKQRDQFTRYKHSFPFLQQFHLIFPA